MPSSVGEGAACPKVCSCRAIASPYSPKSRQAAAGSARSPFDPRESGPPCGPSLARGAGRSFGSEPATSSMLTACPPARRFSASCPPPFLPRFAVGVGRSRPGAVRRAGRGSPTHSRHGWPLGWARTNTRSRRWQAPTSEARKHTHRASYPRSARSPRTRPSARRAGSSFFGRASWGLPSSSPSVHPRLLSARAERAPRTFSHTT